MFLPPAYARLGQCCRMVFGLALLTCAPGCALLGVAANAVPRYTAPKYAGLAGQSVAVMVWIDRPTMIEWPSMRLDLGNSVQQVLQQNVTKAKELKGTTFPVLAASVVRYQMDHPDTQFTPVTEIAPRLHVTRLVYIEVERFQTRAAASLELYRGVLSATIKVIEVENGAAKVVYEENDVSVVFPKKAPQDGIANATDYDMYRGSIMELTRTVLGKFTTQEVED